jgi:hypothetical protein
LFHQNLLRFLRVSNLLQQTQHLSHENHHHSIRRGHRPLWSYRYGFRARGLSQSQVRLLSQNETLLRQAQREGGLLQA